MQIYRKHPAPKKRRDVWLKGLCLAVVAAIGFVGTYAWTLHQTQLQNNLQSRTVEMSINEFFPVTTVQEDAVRAKMVRIRNDGTDAAFLRVAYADYWETSTQLLTGDTGVIMVVEDNWETLWLDGGDGWYYYTKVLPAGSTAYFMSGVKFPQKVPAGADYKFNILAETVQVSDEADVNTAATKLLFGKTGTVKNSTIEFGAVTAGDVTWS